MPPTMDSQECDWYFAYGSNISTHVFTNRKKVEPLKSAIACIPTHSLCFNIMGIPYEDPGMGGIRKQKHPTKTGNQPCTGLLICCDQTTCAKSSGQRGKKGKTSPTGDKLHAAFARQRSSRPVSPPSTRAASRTSQPFCRQIW